MPKKQPSVTTKQLTKQAQRRALSNPTLGFAEQLASYGLKIRSIPSDGNCLFAAVADQLCGDISQHTAVRKNAVEHMRENSDEFSVYCETGSDDYPAYLTRMAKLGCWGDYMTQNAIARYYNTHIIVHQYRQPRMQINNTLATPETQSKTIHIGYIDNEHYVSVRNIGDDLKRPATQINLAVASLAVSSEDQLVTTAERIVMQSTGVEDMSVIREALADCDNDVDAAVELMIAEQHAEATHAVAQMEAVRPIDNEQRALSDDSTSSSSDTDNDSSNSEQSTAPTERPATNAAKPKRSALRQHRLKRRDARQQKQLDKAQRRKEKLQIAQQIRVTDENAAVQQITDDIGVIVV